MTNNAKIVKEALESADAGIWDGRYGSGLCFEYARIVHSEIVSALAALAALDQMGDAYSRLLNVARGCHDYGGGYSDAREVEIYHHGIQTVIQALEAAAVAPDALQVRVLESIGAASRESTALTPSEERK